MRVRELIGRLNRAGLVAWITAILIAVLPLQLRGQASSVSQTMPASSGTVVLTLDRALAIAAEKNRDIQKAIEYKRWVQGRYLEERAAALPQLVLTSGALRQRDDIQAKFLPDFPALQDALSGQVGITQVIFTWGQVGAAIRAAKIAIDSTDDQLHTYQQAVARDVSSTFYDILLAKELHAIAIENLELKKRHLEEAQRKGTAGTATDYDVLAADVAVQNAMPEVIQTENLIFTMREKLAFLLAQDNADFEVAGALGMELSARPQYDEVLQTALTHRPELSELSHLHGIADELVKIAKAGDKPRLDFSGYFNRRNLRAGDFGIAGNSWSTGVYLTFPLFDGFRTKGKVISAKSDVRSLEIELAKLRDGISLEVRTALNSVREAEEIVKALSGTVSQAEQLLRMAEKGYEYGVKTHLDVKDAQVNLMSAKGQLAKAQRDYRVALVTLKWVNGTLDGGQSSS